MTDDKTESLTLEEYNRMEEQRKRRNTWSIACEVTMGVDGAPWHVWENT